VTVEENETSTKMCLSGTYNLELTPTLMSLSAPSGAKIFTLSYKFLKNYGKQSGQFHFETGKNSPIGMGKLIFVTTCSKEVFGVVHNNIKRMRENSHLQQPVRKTSSSSEVQVKPEQQKTQAVARPQPFQSVPAPPLPQKQRQPQSISNRPSSRHSTEIADAPVVGTYRMSKDLEDETKASTSSTAGDTKVDDVAALYSTVDMSKKKSRTQSKTQQQKSKWRCMQLNWVPDPIALTTYNSMLILF
jgi:hypothetical protein